MPRLRRPIWARRWTMRGARQRMRVLPPGRRPGILTISKSTLTEAHLIASGVFPHAQQNQIALQLAESLQGVPGLVLRLRGPLQSIARIQFRGDQQHVGCGLPVRLTGQRAPESVAARFCGPRVQQPV